MKITNEKVVILAAVSCCLLASLVDVVAQPIANLSERWTNSTAGWTFALPQKGLALFTNETLLLKFNSRSSNSVFSFEPDASLVMGTTNASQGRFSGDFSGMESIVFEVCVSNVSAGNIFFGNAPSQCFWATSFAVPPSASQWKTVEVPLASNRWKYVGAPGVSSGFAADLANVTDIYIEVIRNLSCYSEQTFLVDNLKVAGPWCGPFTNGVSTYWFQEYGLVGTNVDAFADKDGDGLNNLGEYLAWTNPKDSNSTFRVSIDKDSAGRTVLRWPHAKGRTFGIWKATDLTPQGGFDKVVMSLQDQGTENSLPVGDGSSASFYRVEIEQ